MENYTRFFEILDHHARIRGDKIAVYYGHEKVTYAELNEKINRFGNGLKKMGVTSQDQVVLALPDGPDFYYAFFGAMKCGARPALASTDLSREDYEYIINDAQASVLITVRGVEGASLSSVKKLFVDDETYPSWLAGASADFCPHLSAPEEIAFLLYTSGSTGKPKGVPHSQRDMLFTARQYAGKILNMTEHDVVFSASKMFFAYGFGNSVTFPLYYGASVALLAKKPEPCDVFRMIEQYQPTLLFCVPTAYNMLIKTIEGPVLLPSLRLCVSAGEALPVSTYRIWKQLTGLEIINGAGSTETLHIVISNRPGEVRPESSGFAVPGYEMKILGEDGLPVKSGTQGILHVRGQSITPFYWNLPEKSAETILPGGLFKTGDYYMEEEGCYTYQGREDDMFKVGGAWVSPLKVEEAMRSHPSVMECAVASRKFEGLLVPMAYVVLSPDFVGDMDLTRELRTHVLNQLPGHMCPVQINYVDDIPKTRTGKVQRYILKR